MDSSVAQLRPVNFRTNSTINLIVLSSLFVKGEETVGHTVYMWVEFWKEQVSNHCLVDCVRLETAERRNWCGTCLAALNWRNFAVADLIMPIDTHHSMFPPTEFIFPFLWCNCSTLDAVQEPFGCSAWLLMAT